MFGKTSNSIAVQFGLAAAALLVLMVNSTHAKPIVDGENLAVSFRTTVAQAIRDNVARQQQQQQLTFAPVGNVQTTTINFPAARSNLNAIGAAAAAPALPNLPALPTLRSPARPTQAAAVTPAVWSNVPEAPVLPQHNDINNVDNDYAVAAEDIATLAAMEQEQSKNAHYSFDSSVQDTINGHSHTRQETRDGLSLRGSYSYSDGFFQRTVHYEADEGGYRVTKWVGLFRLRIGRKLCL